MLSVTTTTLLLALAAAPNPPQWMNDYGAALRQARAEARPLLVVLEAPAVETNVSTPVSYAATEAELLGHYKLCRIDVRTPYGKSVAAAFKATAFPHTAII